MEEISGDTQEEEKIIVDGSSNVIPEKNKSANLIQKAFRKYRNKKKNSTEEVFVEKQGDGEEIIDSLENESEQIEEETLYDDFDKLKLYSKKVIDDIHFFYRKVHLDSQKKKNLKKLCSEINEISAKLKAVTKLDECKTLPSNFNSEKLKLKAGKQHEEHLGKFDWKWWQRIQFLDY